MMVSKKSIILKNIKCIKCNWPTHQSMTVDEHCTEEDLWLLENHPNSSNPSKQYSRLKNHAGKF